MRGVLLAIALLVSAAAVPGAEPPPAWQKLGRDAFPLKVQRAGDQISFEVTKIERKPLDASLFAVPDGFQNMSGMGRGRPPR